MMVLRVLAKTVAIPSGARGEAPRFFLFHDVARAVAAWPRYDTTESTSQYGKPNSQRTTKRTIQRTRSEADPSDAFKFKLEAGPGLGKALTYGAAAAADLMSMIVILLGFLVTVWMFSDTQVLRKHGAPDLGLERRRESEVQRVATRLDETPRDDNLKLPLEEEVEFNPEKVRHTLGESVSDWDEQRAAYQERNKGSNSKHSHSSKPRLLMVSGSQPKPCDNPKGNHFILKNLKNKVDYCRLHEIDLFYNMAQLDKKISGFWSKLPLLRAVMLAHPDVEWIWWVDSDAFFTDMKFKVPTAKYEDYNLVVHGWYDVVYEHRSWVGLNTGSFLIRNCQWSLDLLDAWAPYGQKGKPQDAAGHLFTKYLQGRKDFESDDQSALIYLLLSQREKWAQKTFLESSYFLHGYWVILVENFEKMMQKYQPGLGDERWPLVTHFVGCKPCHGNYGTYARARCTKEMERAFNFADNQVLEDYGYMHPNLSTYSVEKLVPKASDIRHAKLRG
ncbi:hypothetical protein R1sor_002744 [Riccia sorocarpa]|uniref:Uncharacterized protein n=1 Tax=Riccia sorocarpa TaxID=122646 RepID=A0ABD3GZP4_9MARC